MKPKRLGVRLDFDHFKSGGPKTIAECIGRHRDERVADVNQPHEQAVQAIGAEENSSRLQDAPHFTKELVLKCSGVDVVKHSERNAARELPAGKRHGRGIALDDFDIAATQARSQRLSPPGILFDCGESLDPLPQQIGCEPRSGSQLQNVLSQVRARECPGKPMIDGFSPAIRAAQPVVDPVHRLSPDSILESADLPATPVQLSDCEKCLLSIL
jgi:hypothetical protein